MVDSFEVCSTKGPQNRFTEKKILERNKTNKSKQQQKRRNRLITISVSPSCRITAITELYSRGGRRLRAAEQPTTKILKTDQKPFAALSRLTRL
jgi:hypothetical protein